MQALSNRINKPTYAQRWLAGLVRHNQRVASYPKGPYGKYYENCRHKVSQRTRCCVHCGLDSMDLIRRGYLFGYD